jgi:Na+/H+ antiporter NhaD/arsenite permease-like protein
MDQNTTAGQYHTNRIEKGDFTSTQDNGDDDYGDSKVNNMESQKGHIELIPHLQIDTGSSQHGNTDVLKSKPRLSPHYNKNRKSDAMTNDLIDKKKKKRSFVKTAIKYIITPFPYAMLVIMAIMVALMFVDMISISGLICITAVFMVVVLVLGNHYQGLPIYGTAENDGLLSPIPLPSMTTEEKIKNTEEFLEELFKSIDYNLLLIFLGLFIVVENIAHTGIPKLIWSNIVGRKPFGTASSVICISLFVLIVSQFLGNVAVVQLALPNVEQLTDSQRKYAWALISFVSTVGGNLTITGSAANIIVAEKAARIDPNSSITFYAHLKVCFVVTLVSCVLGALMITGISICEEATFGS